MEQQELQQIYSEIGLHIRDCRKKRRLTQCKLAIKCGMEASCLNRIEHGNTNPTVKSLFLIAQALDVPVKRLVKGL